MNKIPSILSSNPNTHTEVVAVYDHQVIVKRQVGRILVECSKVTEIGNVPCHIESVCWHATGAVNFLSTQKGLTVEWFKDEDAAWWEWGTTLYSHRYTVEAKNGCKTYIVASKQPKTVTLVLQ